MQEYSVKKSILEYFALNLLLLKTLDQSVIPVPENCKDRSRYVIFFDSDESHVHIRKSDLIYSTIQLCNDKELID